MRIVLQRLKILSKKLKASPCAGLFSFSKCQSRRDAPLGLMWSNGRGSLSGHWSWSAGPTHTGSIHARAAHARTIHTWTIQPLTAHWASLPAWHIPWIHPWTAQASVAGWIVDELPFIVMSLLIEDFERLLLAGAGHAHNRSSAQQLAAAGRSSGILRARHSRGALISILILSG